MASLLLWRGLLFPIVGIVSSGELQWPPPSLSHALYSFLEGNWGALRESRWSEPCEALSWLYSPGVRDRPMGHGASPGGPRVEKAGDGMAQLPVPSDSEMLPIFLYF